MKLKLDSIHWERYILFLTMLCIFWQAKTASNEYRIRNKPVVGIENVQIIDIVDKNEQRKNKSVAWDAKNKNFVCDGNPIELQGLTIIVSIKNFGTEAAVNFDYDTELLVGNNLIKTKDPEFKNSIMMPGEDLTLLPEVSKEDLYNAFINNKPIKLKCTFKYSDSSNGKETYESFAEISLKKENDLSGRIIDGYLKDKRFIW